MKIQFMVEGHLEQKFLRNVCLGMSAIRSVPNGKLVPIEAIAERLVTHIKLAQSKNAIPVIIFDREQRSEHPEQIREDLLQALKEEHGLDTKNVQVFVVDRMIENWVIAAWDEQVVDADSIKSPKVLLKNRLGGYSTAVGLELLKKGVPSRMAKKSASFCYLYENLPVKDCWWLSKEDDSS